MGKALASILFVLIIVVSSAPRVNAGFELENTENRFTLIAAGISFQSILNKIQEETEITFDVAPHLLTSDKISVNINTSSVETGLVKLLKHYNKIFTYNNTGLVTSVKIFGKVVNVATTIKSAPDELYGGSGTRDTSEILVKRVGDNNSKFEAGRSANSPESILNQDQMIDNADAAKMVTTNPDYILDQHQLTGEATQVDRPANNPNTILRLHQEDFTE